MIQYHRETLFSTELMFGFDSTQGYLEFATSSEENKSQVAFGADQENNYSTHLYKLKQLEKEGYIDIEWSRYVNSTGDEYIKIKQMCLTTSGRELLTQLKRKSRKGELKERTKNLIWVILTSIATTLIVLQIKGG